MGRLTRMVRETEAFLKNLQANTRCFPKIHPTKLNQLEKKHPQGCEPKRIRNPSLKLKSAFTKKSIVKFVFVSAVLFLKVCTKP